LRGLHNYASDETGITSINLFGSGGTFKSFLTAQMGEKENLEGETKGRGVQEWQEENNGHMRGERPWNQGGKRYSCKVAVRKFDRVRFSSNDLSATRHFYSRGHRKKEKGNTSEEGSPNGKQLAKPPFIPSSTGLC